MKTRLTVCFLLIAAVALFAQSFSNGVIIPPPFRLVFGLGNSTGDVQISQSASSALSMNGSLNSTSALTVTGDTASNGNISANGASWTRGQISESITLATGGLTTDSTANLLPANSLIDGVVCRVTTTITTATSWAVGDATTAARFIAADSTLTANETQNGIIQWNTANANAAGPVQTAAAKLRITAAGSNPGAGVVRCTTFYSQFVAPTS